jgi:hypothetical protein
MGLLFGKRRGWFFSAVLTPKKTPPLSSNSPPSSRNKHTRTARAYIRLYIYIYNYNYCRVQDKKYTCEFITCAACLRIWKNVTENFRIYSIVYGLCPKSPLLLPSSGPLFQIFFHLTLPIWLLLVWPVWSVFISKRHRSPTATQGSSYVEGPPAASLFPHAYEMLRVYHQPALSPAIGGVSQEYLLKCCHGLT